jgi:hypothetical protein
MKGSLAIIGRIGIGIGIGIGILCLFGALRLAAADAQRTCYKLIAVITPLDMAKDPESKDWADSYAVTAQADGTILVTDKKTPSRTWRVNAKQANAEMIDGTKNPPYKMEGAWTIPPDYWCSDLDYTITLTVKATGDNLGGLQLYQSPAERWDQSPGTQVQGTNPFGIVEAGHESGGDVPSASGSITLRPKLKGGDKYITLGVNVRYIDGGSVSVAYRYERYDGPVPPPSPPPTPQLPTPPGGCPKTFAKDWGSTWGQMPIHLDGDKVTGTYTNRLGLYGPGTFAGTVSSNTLTADWKDASGGASGAFVLTLSDDGCSFTSTNTVKSGSGDPTGPIGTDHSSTTDTPNSPTPPPTPTTPATPTPTNSPTTSTGTGLPAEPCSDPIASDCIQKWLDKAMGILNRRDTSNPAPGGPWHVSKYGKLLGHQVIADGPPDGWESTYHSNVYCYIWATWQQSHLNPEYGGELESLASFVSACYAAHTGGNNPGTSPSTSPSDSPLTSKMTLWAQKRKAQSGEMVMLPIWLLKGADVANMNFTASYAAAIAKPEGDVTKGYLLGDDLLSGNTGDAGTVRIGFAGAGGISGDGPVAYVPFRVTGKPGDKTPITLAVTTINNPSGGVLPIDVINGEILIVGPDGMIPGDCDGDGVITAADAWCALRMSVKLMPEKPNMDMDHDGQVTSRDAAIILQKVVGK